MIYAFLTDEAHLPIQSTLQASDLAARDVGIYDSNLLSMFNNHGRLLSSTGDSVRQAIGFPNKAAYGNMALHYDDDKLDGSDEALRNFTQATITKLFNIIECAFYYRTSINVPERDDIEAALVAGIADTYDGYVEDSLTITTAVSASSFRYADDTTTATPYDFFEGISFSITDPLSEQQVDFTVWFSRDSFKSNYPLSTILQVIYPCEATKMLDPGTDNLDDLVVVFETSEYKNNIIMDAVAARDHTGIATFNATYMLSEVSTYDVEFSLLYKGAVPKTSEMRQAISDAILAEEDGDGVALANVEEWKVLFPTLFTTSTFYLIPAWNSILRFINNDIITRGITSHTTLYDNVFLIYPNMDTETVRSRMEVIQAANSRVLVSCLPSTNNDASEMSLLGTFPTYQPLDSGDDKFDTMQELEKNFCISLGAALLVAQGLVAPSASYIIETLDEVEYCTFIVGTTIFHMVTETGQEVLNVEQSL